MAKKKRKKKNRHGGEAAVMPGAAQEQAAGISASALASFSRDLSRFGSRCEKPSSGPPAAR
jgi:hypothetical protein